jgi:thiamine-monophosphate kinase
MESALLAWLRRRLPAHPCLRLGPGDDAAVLRLADGPECVVTVDLISDGVDFDLRTTDPRRIGRKALAVNLSDIAAMASRPVAAVIAVALPKNNALELAIELYEGLLPLAERWDMPIAGGDIQSWDGPLVISVTLLGQPTAKGPLVRGGARPGDKIVVTGAFGGSILGRHLDFEPRIDEALLLAERFSLHAGMDVSDGLSLDLSRLCQESACGAVVELQAVPIHPDAQRLAQQSGGGKTPLEHALGDGEDFELLLAVPPAEAERMCREQPLGVPLTMVGEFVAEPGLWSVDAHGARAPLAPRGYEH